MNTFLSCSLLVTLGLQLAAAHSHLRRDTAVQLPIAGPDHDQKVMDAISQFRAEICAKMHDENGKDFASYEACSDFMEEACHPGKDKQMDGDKREVTSQKGFCTEYFPEAKKKAEEKVTKEEEEEEAQILEVAAAPAPSPGASPGPAPAPVVAAKAPAPAPTVAGPGPAPAPGPIGSPGPAPVPAPFIPGVSAGKPFGPIEDDEAYYFKKGGKDPSRLHMSAEMKIPEHGYWGKLVEHNDGTTYTDDWGQEFGPKSGHDSYEVICAKQPDNQWCTQNGYHRHKSSSTSAFAKLLPLVCLSAAMRFL